MKVSHAGLGLNITNNSGIYYVIETPTGVLYMIWATVSRIAYAKSFDRGLTWGKAEEIANISTTTMWSVWYDRWSGIAAGLIHVAWVDSTNDNGRYRTINTESSDSLSTQTEFFQGATTAAGGNLSITRARGGNVYVAIMIDAGAEGGFFRLPNANVPNGAWDAARATVQEASSGDQVILVPGFAADDQDIMAFFWDGSADEISRKVYDDSANSWAETTISGAGQAVEHNVVRPHWAAAVDLTNSQNWLIFWQSVDNAVTPADLRVFKVSESAITQVTDVVSNVTDDCGGAAIAIDVNNASRLYAFWWGNTDGSETFATAINLYMKVSTDGGTTWGSAVKLTDVTFDVVGGTVTVPRFYFGTPPVVSFRTNNTNIPMRMLLLAERAQRRGASHIAI